MATILEQKIANAASGKSRLSFNPVGTSDSAILDVPPGNIRPDETQPRKDFGDIEELKASIKEHGVITPIIISRDGPRYRIIAGERRYRASVELNLDTIPAIVRTVADQNRLELQIIENLHRKDLNPIEEAKSYRRLVDEFNLTQEQVAERIGKSKSSINELLRLLDLPVQEINELCSIDSVSKSVLVEIARNSDPLVRKVLLSRAKSGKLTVNEARDSNSSRRKAKSKTKGKSHRFLVSRGEVVVRIREGYATVDDIRLALREALEQLGEKETT